MLVYEIAATLVYTVPTDTIPATFADWSDVSGMVSDFYASDLVVGAVAVLVGLVMASLLVRSIKGVFGGA